MSTAKNKNEEEVDLGSLFTVIGKGFKNFFNFIGSIFKGIFHFLIITLLFFKEHLLKIIVAGLLGFIFGAYLDYNKGVIYESKMLVKPNFDSTKQLYGNILFYNDLVNQKEYNLLMETFQINQEEAESLREFSIKALMNENDIIISYDELAVSVDTLAINDYDFESFKKAFTNYDYFIHEVKVTSTQNKIFKKFDKIILSSVSENDYFRNINNSEKSNLDRSYNLYDKNISQIDTLRKVYENVLLENAKKSTSGTNINLSAEVNKNVDIELFKINRNLDSYLTQISEKKSEKDKIINVISSFQKVGNISGGILKSSKFIYFSIGFIVMVFMLLLIKLNAFLDKYTK